MVKCWVCGATQLTLAKPGNAGKSLSSSDFAITDAGYGKTLSVYRCSGCGFMQCHEIHDAVSFYESLSDHAYEAGREQRMLQADALLKVCLSHLAPVRKIARLLDIGAGSGILLEAATRRGISAEGVEPSSWLAAAARKHGCRVFEGTLPHSEAKGPYDIITIVDVIEHVTDPLELLRHARRLLSSDGIMLVVTPDSNSIAARLMGWKWWHYRVAHIGYFQRRTLELACESAGLSVRHAERPGWYFTVSYLRERLLQYLPDWLLPKMAWMDEAVVPLNLYDSLLFVCSPRPSE